MIPTDMHTMMTRMFAYICIIWIAPTNITGGIPDSVSKAIIARMEIPSE